MSKTVLLIQPPFFRLFGSMNNRICLQLHTLAEHIKSLGHDAYVYNADREYHEIYADWASIAKNWDMYADYIKNRDHPAWTVEIPKVIDWVKPDMIIIGAGDIIIPTVDVGSLASSLVTAKVCKPHSSADIVGYGPLVTFSDMDFAPYFDAVIDREAETCIESIINSGIKGYVGMMGEGHGLCVRFNGGITPPEVLEKIPFLDPRTVIGSNPIHPSNFDYISSERGCPFDCSFCLSPAISRKLRAVSVGRFVDEIQYRHEVWGVEHFYFTDLTFTANKKRVLEICAEINARDLPIKWHCESRVDTVDLPLLFTMEGAGCTAVKYGVEVGTTKMLYEINKGTSLQQAVDAVEMTHAAGMKFIAYVLLGTPNSTADDYEVMYQFLKDLGADHYVINIAAPHKGTKLHNSLEEAPAEDILQRMTHLSHDLLSQWNLTDEIVDKFMSLGKAKEDAGYRKYVSYEERQRLLGGARVKT